MRKATSLASALAVLAIATALQSCDWRTPAATGDTAADSAATAAFCTAEFSDSVAINNATAYAEIKADFPAEEDSSLAAQAVLEWLCREVRGRCYPDYVGESVDSAFSLTTNEGTFAENVVNTYGRKGLDNMANDLREMAIDGYEGFMGNYLTIELTENTPDYLTFTLEHDVYTGGAHGGQYHYGQTFSKADGKTFTWAHFAPEKRSELIELIKKGLMAYFNEGAEEPITTDSALFEHLILYDNPDTPENELEYGIPLPLTAPWITRDGVCFIYQEYEIAAYAMGRPTVTLPLSVVAPCLTDEGRKFLSLK